MTIDKECRGPICCECEVSHDEIARLKELMKIVHSGSVWTCLHHGCVFMRVKFYLMLGAFVGLVLVLLSGCARINQ